MAGKERPVIVGAGRISLEFVGVIPRFPAAETASLELEEISVQVGGNAAVATGTAAALGCETRLACKLADDFLASFMMNALSEANIEPYGNFGPGSRLSPMGFTVAERHSHNSHTFRTNGDAGVLNGEDLDAEKLLRDASALMLDGNDPKAQLALAKYTRGKRIPVILDCTTLSEGLTELVAQADILICSERVAAELAPSDDTETMLKMLKERGPKAVVVTMGEAGAVALHKETVLAQPIFNVPVVDSHGAGSVFHGAFVVALTSELPFDQCLRFASAAAALSCRRLGPWAGIPTRDEILQTAGVDSN